MAAAGMTRIGISGWRYPPWRGTFYPEDLAQRRELEYASRRFNSIEINGSFYSLQRPSSYAEWYDTAPPGFVFAVKGGRFITHMKKLRGVETATANFFASGVLALREKLGPILWQFPPILQFNAGRFKDFFALLPRDTRAAARLARRQDRKGEGRTFFGPGGFREIRHAVEVRHESFRCAAFIELLRRQQIALVVADTAGKWPYMEDTTADFVYVRLHGDEELYVSGYTDRALDRWAARIRAWSAGRQPRDARLTCPPSSGRVRSRDVYVYFDNDAKVRAPYDAMSLMRRLRVSAPDGNDDAFKSPSAARRRAPGKAPR